MMRRRSEEKSRGGGNRKRKGKERGLGKEAEERGNKTFVWDGVPVKAGGVSVWRPGVTSTRLQSSHGSTSEIVQVTDGGVTININDNDMGIGGAANWRGFKRRGAGGPKQINQLVCFRLRRQFLPKEVKCPSHHHQPTITDPLPVTFVSDVPLTRGGTHRRQTPTNPISLNVPNQNLPPTHI